MIKVALLTTDSREHFKDYANPSPYFGIAPEALLEGFKLLPEKIEVHVVSCLQKIPASSPTKLAENIYYHALHVPNIGWLKTGYQGCIWSVRRKLRDIKPDIVHGQGTERDCAISAVFSCAKNVITIHGNIAELARIQKAAIGSFYWLQGKLEGFCLRRTSGVFCNSQYTRSLVEPRTSRCWMVPNAIRQEFFRAPVAGGKPERPTVLNVGVVSPRKRQVELMELAARMFAGGCPAVWQFVGNCNPDNAYSRKFLDLITEARSLGYAEYLGELDRNQLISAMDRAHMLVHFPYEEAFGLVAPEALARDLFILSSDVGGLRDILRYQQAAKLIPPEDFGALESAICERLNSAKNCAAQPSDKFVQRYAPINVAKMHLDIYAEVISGAFRLRP